MSVSWDRALNYCHQLAQQTRRLYRAPTAAEWEKAARVVDGRRYPWGDHFDATRCNALKSGVGATTASGAYAARGDGVYICSDMVRNVSEWTGTRWGIARSRTEFAPSYRPDHGCENLNPTDRFRELRICFGGSYRERADRVTCTSRIRQPADSRDPRRGLLVAVDEA